MMMNLIQRLITSGAVFGLATISISHAANTIDMHRCESELVQTKPSKYQPADSEQISLYISSSNPNFLDTIEFESLSNERPSDEALKIPPIVRQPNEPTLLSSKDVPFESKKSSSRKSKKLSSGHRSDDEVQIPISTPAKSSGKRNIVKPIVRGPRDQTLVSGGAVGLEAEDVSVIELPLKINRFTNDPYYAGSEPGPLYPGKLPPHFTIDPEIRRANLILRVEFDIHRYAPVDGEELRKTIAQILPGARFIPNFNWLGAGVEKDVYLFHKTLTPEQEEYLKETSDIEVQDRIRSLMAIENNLDKVLKIIGKDIAPESLAEHDAILQEALRSGHTEIVKERVRLHFAKMLHRWLVVRAIGEQVTPYFLYKGKPIVRYEHIFSLPEDHQKGIVVSEYVRTNSFSEIGMHGSFDVSLYDFAENLRKYSATPNDAGYDLVEKTKAKLFFKNLDLSPEEAQEMVWAAEEVMRQIHPIILSRKEAVALKVFTYDEFTSREDGQRYRTISAHDFQHGGQWIYNKAERCWVIRDQ